MKRPHLKIYWFLWALIGSCSSSHRIDQGKTSMGEANQNEANIENDTLTSEVLSQAPDFAVDENIKTATEPVVIGGAFLTCSYKNGQLQGSDSFAMDCGVMPVADVATKVASADFYKIDAQGQPTPLKVTKADLTALQWTVTETVATMAQATVEIRLNAPGLLSTSLTTLISPQLSLVSNPSFWANGEPNSSGDEDCVQFFSNNAVINSDSLNGVSTPSGPLSRLNDKGCTAATPTSLRFLCRKVNASSTDPKKWVLSTSPGVFDQGATACDAGYTFGAPLNSTEVEEVKVLVNAADVSPWINMNDRAVEGQFSITFR